MMSQTAQANLRPRASTVDEADGLVQAALRALDELEPLIIQETELLRDGRLHPALDIADRKAPAAQYYQRALEDIKANTIALGRFMPASLEKLRERHENFANLLSLNMAVLGTAKTVSESIVRELATDIGRARAPQGYGITGQAPNGYRTPAAPLSVSKSL
jgi:hypothetical protein